MFTGIIEEVGKISRISRKPYGVHIGVSSYLVYPKVEVSGSLAVNGVCLTVVKKQRNILFFDVVKTTLQISNLKRLKYGDFVNLESSLTSGDKVEGHFVLGHIDTEARIKRVIKTSQKSSLEIEVKSAFRKYLVARGSVTLDGISLTISRVYGNILSVNIIPYTWQHTNLRYKKPSSYINLEFDYLVKAVLKSSGKV